MKKCTKCKVEKELSEFNKKSSTKDGLQKTCKECQREHSREYYKLNKERQKKIINEARRKRVKDGRKKYFNILRSSSCVDCGEKNPMVLEFDHRDDVKKIMTINELVHGGYSWEKVEIEMAKCDVRCANCHRIRTAEQYGWYKDLL